MTEVNFHIPEYEDADPRSNVRLLKTPRKHSRATNELRVPKWTAEDGAGEHRERRHSHVSADLDVDSQVSRSSQDTEKDVFFPLRGQNPRPDDIDFTELDQYLAEERALLSLNSTGSHTSLAPILASGSSRSGDVSQNALRYTPKLDTATERSFYESLNSERSTLATDSHLLSEKLIRDEYASPELSLPDRFSYYHSLHDETIHAPDLLTLIPEGQSTSVFFNDGESTWWLDCTCATDEEVQALAKAFALHPLTAEDIRMQEPREKVEMFHNYYFMSFHTFEQDRESEDFLEPIYMYVVVFRAGLLTFHSSETSNPANVRRRIRQLREYVDVSSDWICYALIDDVTDGFAPLITSIEYEADAIDDSVFITRLTDFGSMLKRIGECRQTVMSLMKLLSNKADVIKMFSKRCQEGAAEQHRVEFPQQEAKVISPRGDIALYLGDIQDHIVTMFQNLSAYEKILSRSQANYLAQLQVESFDSNLSFTKLLETVTILGTLFVPINIVTGLFGMNVLIPGKENTHYWWFIGIVLILLTVSMLMFVLVKIYAHSNTAVKEVDFDDAMVKSIRSGKMKRSKAKSMVSFRGYEF